MCKFVTRMKKLRWLFDMVNLSTQTGKAENVKQKAWAMVTGSFLVYKQSNNMVLSDKIFIINNYYI